MFTVLTMLMYFLAFAASPTAYAQALTGWFDRRRGLALSLMFCVGALGVAIWPAYAALLIRELGWRSAFGVMGATAGTVIFLCGAFLIRNPPRPEERGIVAGEKPVPAGMAASEALRTVRFWKIFAIFTLLSAVLGGTAVQLPVILRQHGDNAQLAASIMAVFGICMFLGRLLLSFVLDRWFSAHATIAITAVSIVAFVIMIVSTDTMPMFVAAGFVGFGMGSEYAVAAYMVSRAFGFRAYGAIYGLITLGTGIGVAVGPAVMGVSLVMGVSTDLIFTISIVLLALPILLLLTLKRSDLAYGVATTG